MVLSGCTATGPAVTTATATRRPAYPTAPTFPQPTCGQAVTHLLGADTTMLSAGKGALSCFTSAMRRCAHASLSVNEMGADVGTVYQFDVRAGTAPCQVTELSQGYTMEFPSFEGFPSYSPIASENCRLRRLTAAGATLSCPDGAVLIPATVAPQA